MNAIESASSDMELRDKVAGELMVAATLKIERDVLISELTSDELRILADAAIATVQEAGWRDIEDADSTTGHCIFVGATKHDYRKVFSGWVAINGMCYTDSGEICQPTHFMPLPPFEGTKT